MHINSIYTLHNTCTLYTCVRTCTCTCMWFTVLLLIATYLHIYIISIGFELAEKIDNSQHIISTMPYQCEYHSSGCCVGTCHAHFNVAHCNTSHTRQYFYTFLRWSLVIVVHTRQCDEMGLQSYALSPYVDNLCTSCTKQFNSLKPLRTLQFVLVFHCSATSCCWFCLVLRSRW